MASKQYTGIPRQSVKIRSSCSISSSVVGTLAAGEEFLITDIKVTTDTYDSSYYDYQTNTEKKITVYVTYKWGIISSGKCVLLFVTTNEDNNGKYITKTDWYVDTTNISKNANNTMIYNMASNMFNNTSLINSVDTSNEKYKKTMQLFGLPYQFLNSVDPRVNEINKYVGRNFINRVMLEAPVVTIIPGEPYYLPGVNKDKRNTYTDAFLQGASGSLDQIEQLISDSNNSDSKSDKIRLYDFKSNYLAYIRYVNILCRTCATLLEVNDVGYKYISSRNGSGDATWSSIDFDSFDWKNYRWDGVKYSSITQNVLRNASDDVSSMFNKLKSFGSSMVGVVTGNKNSNGSKSLNLQTDTDDLENDAEASDSMENAFRQVNYVQFYVDPEYSSSSESLSNSSGSSSLKDLLSSGSQKMMDVSFMANSAGLAELDDKMKEYSTSIMDSFKSALNLNEASGSNNIQSVLSRITDVANNIITGNNVIMPDIYQGSSYSKDYSITVHLKALYGNLTSYYMDILVPAMHLLALALPRQNSANSYKSPFLVKVLMDGEFACNLGLVTGIQINKKVSSDSRNTDGLFTEWDITLNIADLYSDLMMTPSNNPLLFLNNSSLIDYLSINCGLNSLEPRLATKLSATINNVKENVKEYIPNVVGKATESIDSRISGWLQIMG